MNTVLILCRKDERHDYDQVQTYKESLSLIKTKCKYVFGELERLTFYYDGNELVVLLDGIDIKEYDQLFLIGWFKTKILEDIALSAAIYMNAHGKPVQNTEALHTRSRSKLSQYVVAAMNGIKLTPFLFSKDSTVLSESFHRLWKEKYPVIMKGVQSSRGNDNYLLEDERSVDNTIALINEDDPPWFVVQGYVPNDGDYRIIVMGTKVTYVMHRKSISDSHLNNTSKGGQATTVPVSDLPAEVLDQCVRLSRLLRREITGVDMIQHADTGEFYLLEINNMPQMATGANVNIKLTLLDEYLASNAVSN